MRIVVLDGYTLNPGDLDWSPLKALGECVIHDRTAPEQVLARAAGAEVLLTNKVVLDKALLGQLPAVRYIGVLATGYNVVDVVAARERGVVVTNVPTYGTASVAQMTFALLLELCRGVGAHARAVQEGRWTASTDFCFTLTPQVELEGRVMGLVGFGRIGQAVAACAQGFGMRVIAHDVGLRTSPVAGVSLVSLETVFREADVVSLHCPLTADNRGLINRERLKIMKPTAFLINTSRGPLVDEAALADALRAGTLAGAGVDVLTVEPPPAGNPLLGAPNCIITPHIAWATRAARARLLQTVVESLAAFQRGTPQNVV
jgi:glycerate dehydrogenase